MIQTNEISFTKPYCLTRVPYLQQFYTFAKEREIKRSGGNLSDFKTILGPKAIKLFKPDMHEAILDLENNVREIQAGLNAIPPVAIENIPINPNLPQDPPVKQQGIPQTSLAIKQWEIKDEIYIDFKNAKLELKTKMQGLLPDHVFDTLKLNAGIEGWANVNPEDVFEYILSDTFSDLSEEDLNMVMNKINKQWDKKLSLKSNLENMVKENNALGAAFPDLKLSDQELFRIALPIAKGKNYRLLPIVKIFMQLPGQHIARSLFSEFSAYLLLHYPTSIHDEGTNHLAFSCENIPQVNVIQPYALAAVNNCDDGGLALAANALPKPLAAKANPPTFKPGEYEEYLQLKAKYKLNPNVQTSKVPPRPPNAPADAKFGKICFNCGWNAVHNSKNCPVMFNDPKFSKAMKSLTQFDPKTDPHTIGGIPVNQSCAPGIYGNH